MACFARATHVWLAVNQNTSTHVSLIANDFDVRSVLHGQVSLAHVNLSCVIHEAMDRCKI